MSSSVTRGCRLFTVIFVPSKGLNASCQHKKMHHIKVKNTASETAQESIKRKLLKGCLGKSVHAHKGESYQLVK